MTNIEQEGNAEFVPITLEQLEGFRGEFGGENRHHLRIAVSSLLGRQSVETRYPDVRLEDPTTFIQFVGEAAIQEASLLDELLENGTVYNGTQMSQSGLDRYRLARVEYIENSDGKAGV